MVGEAGYLWEEVTANDMWAFLGFSVKVGLNKVPALHQHWSRKDLYYNKAIACKISRDCFLTILRYIRFVENKPQSTTATDKSCGKGISHFYGQYFSTVNLYKELLIYATGSIIFRLSNFCPDLW